MCELNVVGLGEVQRSGKCEIVSGNYTMFYSGGVHAEKDAAIMMRNDTVKYVTKVERYSDTLIFAKVSAKPVDTVTVQVYQTQIMMMRRVNAIVMGDFNSIVGELVYK